MEREELLALMVKELPRLLQEHPEACYQLIGILAEVFARQCKVQLKEFYPVAHILRLHD